ncbi:MAG: cytochrome C oxidase subunit IV family protein [Candidatus Wallbacteria bacterium]|nr:cytochrome C oxidase subunit IV family protein [Candidatus Wallbacteria bacterium]
MQITPRVKLYLAIWGALFALTIAEVIITQVGLGKSTVLAGLIVMSGFKAAAVGLFYMHLWWEKAWLGAVALSPFAFTALFAVVLILENGR